MSKNRIDFRLRKRGDEVLKEHFSQVKEENWSHEARRLMEKAIFIERKEKEGKERFHMKYSGTGV